MIRAIETAYKGYRFRSRLEARWAVFFDSLGESWQYEKEGFELEHGRYLPDFYLPRLELWLEIKGCFPTAEEKQKCEDLAWAADDVVAIAWGLPCGSNRDDDPSNGMDIFCTDVTDSSGGTGWWAEPSYWAFDHAGNLCICSANNRSDRIFLTANWTSQKAVVQLFDCTAMDEYMDAARNARFE